MLAPTMPLLPSLQVHFKWSRNSQSSCGFGGRYQAFLLPFSQQVFAKCTWSSEQKWKPFRSVYTCCCSVAQSCLTLCDPMDCRTPGLPILHHLPEFAQTYIHWVADAIQPSHTLSPFHLLPSIFLSIRVFSSDSKCNQSLDEKSKPIQPLYT